MAAVAVTASPAAAATVTVEAESRVRDAGYCASDGERVDTNHWPDQSGGAILFLPHDGCWAEWDVDTPIESITMTVLRPNGTGSGINECHIFDVAIDGARAGSSAEQCGGPGDPQIWQTITLVEGLRLLPGMHTVRVTMRITAGPSWGNAYIDYLTISGTPAGTPTEPLEVAAHWELAERRVVVDWDAPASEGDAPITAYRVYRAEGEARESLVGTVGDVRSFTDDDVAPGRTYGYRVGAVNEKGEGLRSVRAPVTIPGGTFASTVIPVGPSEPRKVVEIAGRNTAGLYCVTAMLQGNPAVELACANTFGAPVPDVGPVEIIVPAGQAIAVDGRYFYDPDHVVTAATALDGQVVVRGPVAPADAAWLQANAALVGAEITVSGTTVVIPALGQVLGALDETSVSYY